MSRRLGLIGGLAWPSTALYYQHINTGYQRARGGSHSAPLLLWSFDFQRIDDLKQVGDWDGVTREIGTAAQVLEDAGAGALVICTNTIHKLYRQLEAQCSVPILHIADAVGAHLRERGLSRVGLLGTRFTMSESFYGQRLADHDIAVVEATPDEIRVTNDIIYDQLVVGRIEEQSREAIRAIVADMAERGAQAAILGCTELALLQDHREWAVPLVDTTVVHSQAAVDWLLANS